MPQPARWLDGLVVKTPASVRRVHRSVAAGHVAGDSRPASPPSPGGIGCSDVRPAARRRAGPNDHRRWSIPTERPPRAAPAEGSASKIVAQPLWTTATRELPRLAALLLACGEGAGDDGGATGGYALRRLFFGDSVGQIGASGPHRVDGLTEPCCAAVGLAAGVVGLCRSEFMFKHKYPFPGPGEPQLGGGDLLLDEARLSSGAGVWPILPNWSSSRWWRL